MNASDALTTAFFWLSIIALMIAYDITKYVWKRWRNLSHENMVNTRKQINRHCSEMVSQLQKRDLPPLKKPKK